MVKARLAKLGNRATVCNCSKEAKGLFLSLSLLLGLERKCSSFKRADIFICVSSEVSYIFLFPRRSDTGRKKIPGNWIISVLRGILRFPAKSLSRSRRGKKDAAAGDAAGISLREGFERIRGFAYRVIDKVYVYAFL